MCRYVFRSRHANFLTCPEDNVVISCFKLWVKAYCTWFAYYCAKVSILSMLVTAVIIHLRLPPKMFPPKYYRHNLKCTEACNMFRQTLLRWTVGWKCILWCKSENNKILRHFSKQVILILSSLPVQQTKIYLYYNFIKSLLVVICIWINKLLGFYFRAHTVVFIICLPCQTPVSKHIYLPVL